MKILEYGNKYIYNREYVRNKKAADNKAMYNKVVAYLSEMEKNMIKKNIPVPADWYENIRWRFV